MTNNSPKRVIRYSWLVFISFISVIGAAQAAVVKGKHCAAIQKTINQLPAVGGEVRIPEGVYLCHKPIVIDRDNVSLRGEGAGTLLRLADGANAPVVVMGQAIPIPDTQRRHIVVSDLMIDGNRHNQSSECMGGPCSEAFPLRNNGISIRHCFDCRVERVTVHSASSGGLVTELTSRRLTIRDYTSYNNEFMKRKRVYSAVFTFTITRPRVFRLISVSTTMSSMMCSLPTAAAWAFLCAIPSTTCSATCKYSTVNNTASSWHKLMMIRVNRQREIALPGWWLRGRAVTVW